MIVAAHIALELSPIALPITHEMLAVAGIPLAWMTGAYTGWLLKQAKGRVMWSEQSDFKIAFKATLEMALFGGIFVLYFLFPNYWMLSAVGIIVIYIVGYKHLLNEIRAAQTAPLI